MTDRRTGDILDDLDELLEAERQALLSGNLEKIGRLVDRKEALIDELSLVDLSGAVEVKRVSASLRRNQDLLDHALAGIRDVARRLAAMRQVRRNLDTYDANGSKRSIPFSQNGSLEKRA